jgi:hypothetical protein
MDGSLQTPLAQAGQLQVRLGAKAAGTITILSGIAPGDRLAAGNLAQLKGGVRIQPMP